ncbi:MAG: PKD domain-containing protein, partial [Gemmatimonadota bacterium]|nr:PKD domain-containing protein [Gemmatimonadota bacterium]
SWSGLDPAALAARAGRAIHRDRERVLDFNARRAVSATCLLAAGVWGAACQPDAPTGPGGPPRPAATILAPDDGAVFPPGQAIRFEGEGLDVDGVALPPASLAWESSLDGSLGIGTVVTRTDLALGEHVIRLVATDVQGRSDTASISLTVETVPNRPPSATISAPADGARFTLGRSVTFSGTASDPEDGLLTATALQWESSLDGSIGTGLAFSRSDLSLGTHVIRLVATDSEGAVDTASITIGIGEPPNVLPTAAFSASCTDLTCTFTDASSDSDGTVVSWNWDFGDGGTSTDQSPQHTYATGGTFTVTLTVTDDDAGSDDVAQDVSVTPANQGPTADFTSACTELTCQFSDSSSDADGAVVGWSWNFGDGATSTDQNPLHEYAAGGTFSVTLTVTDDDGATGQAARQVTVNASPTADFTVSCTELTCQFTDGSSDPDGAVTGWQWSFGDGAMSTEQSPQHTYAGGGTFTVTLTVTDDAGATSAPASDQVTVNATPTADFTFACTELSCQFTDASSDPDGSIVSRLWNFGDGAMSTQTNPQHTYAAGGTFTVVLTVTDDDGATDDASRQVSVNARPTADFSFACTDLTCDFTDLSSDPDGTVTGWSWNFGDGSTSTVRNPTHTYGAGGTFTATLTVTDDDGAASNPRSRDVTVTAPNQAPTADFTFSCTDLTCSFTDTSTDPDGDNIVSRSWDFGDGGTSTQRNPSHTYGAAGTFTATLTVTDNRGGTSAPTSKQVTVTAPNQAPTADFGFACTDLACDFTDASTDPDGTVTGWSWDFGDGNVSTAQSPSHTYLTGGTFTVTLTVTDDDGAFSAPTSKQVTVTAPNQAPTADFGFSCVGSFCQFTDASSDPDGTVTGWSWDFGDGNVSTAQSPGHLYAAPGDFTVTLTVTDDGGLSSAPAQRQVTVTAP